MHVTPVALAAGVLFVDKLHKKMTFSLVIMAIYKQEKM